MKLDCRDGDHFVAIEAMLQAFSLRMSLRIVLHCWRRTPVTTATTTATDQVRTPLTLCPSGCRVTIHTDELDAGDRSMLEAMGVDHGCEVEICKVGSPCILRTGSTRLGVGREVAARIKATLTVSASSQMLS